MRKAEGFMSFATSYIKWIMLISGVLTVTVGFAAIAPQTALLSNFGESLDGPLANLIVRNWAILVTLMGAMLIYGAYNPAVRSLVLTVAGTSKIAFIGLVLSEGSRYLGHQAGIAIAFDALWVALFGWYLLANR
jgi:hypothetical protein